MSLHLVENSVKLGAEVLRAHPFRRRLQLLCIRSEREEVLIMNAVASGRVRGCIEFEKDEITSADDADIESRVSAPLDTLIKPWREP